jgi:hypothetical protein
MSAVVSVFALRRNTMAVRPFTIRPPRQRAFKICAAIAKRRGESRAQTCHFSSSEV